MPSADLIFPAYYVLAMFAGAMVSKALSVCAVFALGLSLVYPDEIKASFLFLFFIPAVLVAAFRD